MMLKIQFGMTILLACLCSPSAIEEAHSALTPRTQSANVDAQVPDDGITVPMKFSASMPAFEVKINDQGPFLFGLDTGASGQARADEKLVEKLELTKVDTTLTTDGTGQGSRALDVFLFDKLELGEATFNSVRAPSRNYNRGTAEPIGGMLGFQLFQEHLLTLDFPGEQLRLTHGELPEANGRTILELDPNRSAPTIEITIGGEPVVCHIDTGNKAGDLILPTSLAEKLPLKGELQVVGNARSVTNQFEIKAAKLDGSVLIGEHEISEPYVMFVDILRTGNIGASLLKQFIVTFDQKNDRVEFEKQAVGTTTNQGSHKEGMKLTHGSWKLSIEETAEQLKAAGQEDSVRILETIKSMSLTLRKDGTFEMKVPASPAITGMWSATLHKPKDGDDSRASQRLIQERRQPVCSDRN